MAEQIEIPQLSTSLPIHFGYKQISAIRLVCPHCRKEYMQDNMRAYVKSYSDGVTTGHGICKCHACRAESNLSLIFRADGSGELCMDDKVAVTIPRGNFILLLINSIHVWSIRLYRRIFPVPSPAPANVIQKAVSNKRSANIVGYFNKSPMYEWLEMKGQRYYFDRVLHNPKEKELIGQDEIVASGCLVYRLRQE